MKKYIEIGIITRPHGINGAVKAEAWCDSPEVLANLKKVFAGEDKNGENFKEFKILKTSVQKDRVILSLIGIDTPEAAEALRNTVIYAERCDIPVAEGSFLIDDLKDLAVIDINDGTVYGKLSDVIQGGAGDIYEIKTENNSVLIPAVKEFIKKIDLGSGIYISPIKGMFDED